MADEWPFVLPGDRSGLDGRDVPWCGACLYTHVCAEGLIGDVDKLVGAAAGVSGSTSFWIRHRCTEMKCFGCWEDLKWNERRGIGTVWCLSMSEASTNSNEHWERGVDQGSVCSRTMGHPNLVRGEITARLCLVLSWGHLVSVHRRLVSGPWNQ
jgi:hypothetical protein